jgi:hypothetical protein
MSESVDALLFDDPEFIPDPECDKQPYVPEGTYSSDEYSCRIVSLAPRKAGEVAFVSMSVLIQHPEIGGVFARTVPFRAGHTQLGKNSGSMWPQFAANLNIDARPQDGESVGEYWARVGEETKNMSVTVTVGVNTYTRKEHRLPQEALDRGEVPIQTTDNNIRNVVAD